MANFGMQIGVGLRLSGAVGLLASLDSDAAARIAQVESTMGSSMTEIQKGAIDTFIKAEKQANRWSSHKRIYYTGWGNAGANAIDLVTGANAAMVNGPTHAAGYIQGNGSTQCMRDASSPGALGLSSTSGYECCLILQADSRSDTRAMMGARTANDGTGEISLYQINASQVNSIIGRVPNLEVAYFPSVTRTGILIANRNASGIKIARRTSVGITRGIVTGSGASGITSAQPMTYMALRDGANDSLHSDARFGLFAVGTGLLSDSDVDGFTTNLKNLFEGLSGLALFAAPAFTVQPSITGATSPGATLTSANGTASGSTSIAGEWIKNGAPTGVTASTYSNTVLGDVVVWRATASGDGGSTSADSSPVTISATLTHSNLPVLGTATVKPVCWSNDETSDAYSEQLVWAMDILGLINLVWHDQTSSVETSIANQNESAFNPTLTDSYFSTEIAARASDFIHAGNSGWDTSLVPAIAGTYKGHMPRTDSGAALAGSTRNSSPPSSSAALVAAIEANYTPDQRVLFVCGGPLTTLADAYLSKTAGAARDAFAAKVLVMFVAGGPGAQGWYNEWADSQAARLIFKHFTCVNFPTPYGTVTGLNVASGQKSGYCATPAGFSLFVGQTLIGAGLAADTYIDSIGTPSGGNTPFTLSKDTLASVTGTREINNRYPAVPKKWLEDRLPNSAIVSRMVAKDRVGNDLPQGIDGDACPLICLLDPTYVTAVTRYSVPDTTGETPLLKEEVQLRNQGSGTVNHEVPAVATDATGNLYYATTVDAAKATAAWWSVMTTARLWTKNSDLVFTPVFSDPFPTNGALGGSWSQFGAIAQGAVANTAYSKSTTGYAYAVPTATYTNDHFAQFKVTQAPATNYFASIGVRDSFASGSNVNGYQFYSTPANSFIQTSSAGVNANVHSGMPAFVAGDTIRVAIKGSLMTVWRNNGAESSTHVVKNGFKLMAVSNRTEHSTGKPSLLCSRNAGPTEFGDDWVSGNVT